MGDKVFYTRATGLRVSAKVVGHSDKGYVELEYDQGGVRGVNHHCPTDSISFGIPSLNSPPPSLEAPPDVPGDEGDGSPLCAGVVACSARAVQGPPLRQRSGSNVEFNYGMCEFYITFQPQSCRLRPGLVGLHAKKKVLHVAFRDSKTSIGHWSAACHLHSKALSLC